MSNSSWVAQQQRERLMLARLLEEQNHRCCYCGEVMVTNASKKNRNNYATLEHIRLKKHYRTMLPGRPYHDDHLAWENVAAACKQCNNRRGELDALVFFEAELWRAENKKLLNLHRWQQGLARYGSRKTFNKLAMVCCCGKDAQISLELDR
jgi:5-methylcytosine-specific restriction endonuclease McrA